MYGIQEMIKEVFLGLTIEETGIRILERLSIIKSFEETNTGTRVFFIGDEVGLDVKESYDSIMKYITGM